LWKSTLNYSGESDSDSETNSRAVSRRNSKSNYPDETNPEIIKSNETKIVPNTPGKGLINVIEV
jgi:hypothetical protein